MILSVVALGAYFFYVNYKKAIEARTVTIDLSTINRIKNAYENVSEENNDNTPN